MAERPSAAPALSALTVPALLAIPGLVHGFEPGRGAPGETRAASQERVGAALASAGRLLLMTQVHGAAVLTAPWLGQPPADAAMAGAPGFLLGIETADCLPILLVDPRRRVVAAAHAGWRGTVAGVVRRVLEVLRADGSDPRQVLAAVGPGIGACCYEVGEEVREAFGPESSPLFLAGPRGRPHLDLRAAVVSQMEGAGLASANIHHLSDCTFCHADHYHSYRRQGPGGGRMISFVGWTG
ncbi:MAG TPA: peptidoglycan editing factor PgeF [Vicinamibacteria bacterium]|nr:peptidoglycan editing factor PgeF [Vicinamibacteria bacterium]